jgi:uncharacterized protein
MHLVKHKQKGNPLSKKSSKPQFWMDRRTLLKLSAVSAGTLWMEALLPHALAREAGLRGQPVLTEMAPSAVTPQGWLRGWLEKQAGQLGYHLPDVSDPFKGDYWEGEEHYVADNHEEDESWWAWEQKGYWIDGALRCALLLNDEKLMERAVSPVRYTLTRPGTNDYLGPKAIESPEKDFHRWPQAVFFRAVEAWADSGDNQDAAKLLRNHFVNDPANYSNPVRNVTNIEHMLWAYQRTGDERLLDLAERAWEGYLDLPPNNERGDLTRAKVAHDAPVDSHGVTYAESSKLPAILYLHTGKREYLDFAVAAQRRVVDRYMLVDGVPSTSEFFQSITSRDVHETCDIADHTWTWGYLLMATGDAAWADRIERACLNAGFGAIRKDWKGVQYLSCPNQMIASLNSSHIPNSGMNTMAYQPNPGQRVACCAGNAHRIFPNYAVRMWMKDGKDGIAAVLYGPSTIKTGVGAAGQMIEIAQETDYPFEENVRFTMRMEKPVKFPLTFRIPGWCREPGLTLNGNKLNLVRPRKGFVTVERVFHPQDVLVLTLPMRVTATKWPEGGIALEHGPLVYSLPIREAWTSEVRERWSTAEFPSWSAEPASAWNYALVLPDASSLEDLKLERTKMTADPWSNPPVRLNVPMRRIDGWELATGADDPSRRYSPPLPMIRGAKTASASEAIGINIEGGVPVRDFLPAGSKRAEVVAGSEVEMVSLVPYGATHLRVTIFPRV